MESHHPINKGKGMLWSDAPLRQLRGCSPDASVSPTSSSRSSPRPRSVVLVDPLPPSTAPLWRNAPNHHHQPPPARRNTPPNHATISPAVSFQQSLRSYPVSSFPSSSTSKGTVHNAATKLGAHPHQHQFNLHQPKNVAAEGPGSRRAGPGTGRLPQSKTVPAALSSAAAPKERTANKKQPSECHVTSLEGESSTPFFLDYLDSQSAMVAANPMLAQPLGAFNHRQFMEMFRSEPSSEQTNANAGQAANAAAAAAFSLSGAAAAGASGAAGGADDLGSLPYAVNTAFETGQQQPQFLLPEHYHLGARSSAAFDSLASTVGSDQQHSYSRPTPVDQRRSAPKSASLASAAAPGGYSKAENIVFRKAPSKTMDNKNSQSNSNISQRLQIAAERRTQIEEARRERVQRQIEQSPRPTVAAAMNSHGFNQNPSVAFGSTRPRNIDLTRPLVTPIPSARPKSEIFPSTFYAGAAHSGGGGGGSTQVDSSSSAYFSTPLKASSQHVFAKDDANYQPATRSPRTPLQPQQSTTTTPSLMSQSMIVPSSSSSNSGGSSNYRAARRHDPELVPAMQKYIFREYAMPTSASSGTPSLRKENSMISSMMSTKSFQQGPTSSSSFYRTPFGGPQNRPKKSYSMNRLDQLAQPRRRVEPKVPTSASFVRPKMEPFTPSSKKPAPATEGGEGRVKPIPPPKTLFKSPRPQTAAAEPSSTSSPSAAAAATPAVPSRSRPATTPKPRPLSQIELSSTQSAAASAEEAANAAANEGEKEFEGSADDRLAEYKRALAEKRAMFRKQQEEQQLLQQQNPVRKAKIVKPEPAPVVAESEESKKAASSSSSSSSSSSEASDNEADNEDDEHKQQQNKPESVSTAVAAAAAPLSVELAQVSSEEAKKTASEAVPAPSQTSSVTESANVNSEQLISFGDSSPSAASPQVPPPRDAVMTGDMMSTSLTGDLAALAINSGANSSRSEMAEKALAGASMTASLDLSLLNENKPGFSGNSKAGATTFTKEQLEERSAQLLQQQMAEREKRKSRVQEILKRTRKDEKAKEGASKQTDSNGSNGDSSQSENEANNGNNSDEASNEQAPVGTSSGGAEDGSSGSKFNGHNGESSGKATTADNGHSNGHLGSNHHRDMKTFVSENEQSLPPTNGF